MMRLKIPLTGTVLSYDTELAEYRGSSGIAGDLNDPIRPVPIDLGNVSWRLIAIDLENDLAEIEVKPSENINTVRDGGNPDNPEDRFTRPSTEQERQGFLNYAKNLVESHTKDELYAMSGKKRLVKSEEIMRKYQEFHSSKEK